MNKTRVLSDQIHDDILEMVIEGSGSESDSVLFTERELVERFQVNKRQCEKRYSSSAMKAC